MTARVYALVGAVLAALATGCAATAPVVTPQVPASPREKTASALADPANPRLPAPLIDPASLLPRRLPGGAPAIDRPRFQPAGDVAWLRDVEPVLAVRVGFETRGYPLRLMLWHEVVNDTVAGIPVVVTYHPVCNTGLAFARRAGQRVLSFAASPWQYAGCALLYDRQTESLWPQPVGRSGVGALVGVRLEPYHSGIVAWRDFRSTYRDAWVLSRDTGHNRPYGKNPYPGHDDPDGPGPPGLPAVDNRLPPMTRVIALPGLGVVFVRSVVASSGVQPFAFGDRRLVAWHRPGQASALDAATVAGGRDIGAVAVFDAVVDDRTLHFTPSGDGFVDAETGTWWTVLGHAVHGQLAGRRLAPQPAIDTFWFAWAGVRPGSQIAL